MNGQVQRYFPELQSLLDSLKKNEEQLSLGKRVNDAARFTHPSPWAVIRDAAKIATGFYPESLIPSISGSPGYLLCAPSSEDIKQGSVFSKKDEAEINELTEQAFSIQRRLRDEIVVLQETAEKELYSILKKLSLLTVPPTLEALRNKATLENQRKDFRNSVANCILKGIEECCGHSFALGVSFAGTWYDMPRKVSGIYMIFDKALLLYIGQSENTARRLCGTGHHVFKRDEHWIALIPCSDLKERLFTERFLIRKFMPVENRVHYPRVHHGRNQVFRAI